MGGEIGLRGALSWTDEGRPRRLFSREPPGNAVRHRLVRPGKDAANHVDVNEQRREQEVDL